MTKAKTVKEHIEEQDKIKEHIADANALVIKLRKELEDCRNTFEALEKFCPNDRFTIAAPYHLHSSIGETLSKNTPMATILKYQTASINKLLGDRA